jgi:tetratricopeptide (TPR) repeat protein
MGDFREAVTYLEPAAEGLPDNPVVLYHLGMTYIALERIEEGRAMLERAVAAGAGREIPQVIRAREALEAL